MSSGGHRQMTKEAGKDLFMLLLVLALIVAGMLAFNRQYRDKEGEAEKEWYYKRIAPPSSSRHAAPTR